MTSKDVSVALSSRLGPAATSGLVDLLDSERVVWTNDVMNLAIDRFERRLTEQVSGLRVDMVRELQECRVDIIKWSFLFWISQVTLLGGLIVGLWRLGGR
ncbi:MAG TPA: hypothetical protein VEU08_07450 [Vicinamibacterales bacterium]|nr:hypothetical protein [Vicinamibacterales bacterium]